VQALNIVVHCFICSGAVTGPSFFGVTVHRTMKQTAVITVVLRKPRDLNCRFRPNRVADS
jgi:hypothetical protein